MGSLHADGNRSLSFGFWSLHLHKPKLEVSTWKTRWCHIMHLAFHFTTVSPTLNKQLRYMRVCFLRHTNITQRCAVHLAENPRLSPNFTIYLQTVSTICIHIWRKDVIKVIILGFTQFGKLHNILIFKATLNS